MSNGEIHNISDVESIFLNIRRECEVENPEISRKKVKCILQSDFNDIKFYSPKRKNEPERVSLKEPRDILMQRSEDTISRDDIPSIFNVVMLLRKSILKSKKWEFKD